MSAETRALDPRAFADLERVRCAILKTIAYADVFDYPLTLEEVVCYLQGVRTSAMLVWECLVHDLIPDRLSYREEYLTLPGRESIISVRQRRAEVAALFWPKAIAYGQMIAHLPFVRMVAVTGALAVDNSDADGDIDYVVVTEVGRLWLCRAMIILLVRQAARRGDLLCPNYLLSERALIIPDRNLYTARELAQMVPLAGIAVYRKMMALNNWARAYFPNAQGPRQMYFPGRDSGAGRLRQATETVLRTPPGAWLETWEMNRKIRRFAPPEASMGQSEISFCADWCKGHFHGHGRRILDAYAERLRALELCDERDSFRPVVLPSV